MENNVLDPALTTAKVDELDDQLRELEAVRASQLDGIDTSPDEVTSAYRETVSRLLEEIKGARRRIADGTYGLCESCGNPIGKMRLMAFPRATLCMSCKQREERR